MKLRNIFAAGLALFALSAAAQVNVEDIRIYINPGHGSWGPNNRHMATIGHSPISTENPDTTDFFESNTNLEKGLALFYRLKDYGFKHSGANGLDLTQNVVMSRNATGPWPYSNAKDEALGYIPDDQNNQYNRRLSEIAAEVESNNFDMFISIHSNAATEGTNTNYLYFAMDGYASASSDKIATSKEMSRYGWNHRILDRHTTWTHYDYTMTAADLAAGKGKIGQQNLGVMNHSVPGYLVEGYFHTYQPSRHRAMNFDVDRLEGIDYARGVADYYGIQKENTGDIYGIVRDKHTKFQHDLYKPNAAGSDMYKPLNGVKVVLYNEAGDSIADYVTDVNYNGVFIFRDLVPGVYTVKFSHPEYKDGITYTSTNATAKNEEIKLEVKAATVNYNKVFLENIAYEPPAIVYVNYPDSLAGKSFALAEEINLAAEYRDAVLCEGMKVRRSIVRNSLEYVLAFNSVNEPSVYVFNTDTKELVKTLGTTAAVGDIYKISDIAMTADGYLVGINKCNQAFASSAGAGNVTAYKWDNDTNGVPDGEVKVWWTNNFAGNWTNGIAGESMTYIGTIAEGKFIYSGTTTASTGKTRLVLASIADGTYIGHMRNNQDETYLLTSYLGDEYNFTLSPNADDKVIINSPKVAPFEIQLNAADAGVPTILAQLSDNILATASYNESYFKYAGRSVMVAPSYNAEGNVDGVKMIDITEGLDKAVLIVTEGTDVVTPVAASSVAANGELALTIDAITGVTTDAEIELFLTVDGKVTKYTTKNVKQPVYTGVYAYDLKSEVEGNNVTLSFNLSAKSHNVNIVLTPASGEGDDIVYNLGALEAGANTYTVDVTDMNDKYSWKVSVANKSIASGEIFRTLNTWGAGTTYYRGGIAVEANPESANFGTTYLGVGRSTGIFKIDPQGGLKNSTPYWAGKFNKSNASSTFRGTLYNDKFYLTDWSDAYPGVWIFDPKSPETIGNIFANATNDGTGKLTIDGVAVGGGSTGVAFTGSGADRKMFIYVEDLPTGNKGNKVYRYDIGAEDTWGAVEPTLLAAPTALLVNTNTGMMGSALHNVVFCSQTRNADQNIASVPAFLVINEAGDIVFNGADLSATLNGCLGGGMALSHDETRFAIIDGSAHIQVYDVQWTNNVPAFTHRYSIATKDQEVCQMAFDHSGNLHCINRKHGYYVHAVPCEARNVETPAFTEIVGANYFEQSYLPDFAPVSEVTVTKVWESTEAIPGSQYGGELRFNTGTDDDVIIIDKANYQVLAWDAAGKRVLHDLKAFFEATEGLYTVSQVIAKVDTISVDTVKTETDTTITVVADTTWADKKTIDVMGTAIAMDDAGNIVVNTNFPNAPSSEEFIIIPADGSEYKYMKLDMAAAGAIAARFDQLGRIVGDVLSAEGAYMWINPSDTKNPQGYTKVAVIKVAEGAQVAGYSMSAEIGAQSTSMLAQPAIFTVAEIDEMYDNEGDVTPTFWLRNRSTSGIVTGWTYNEEEGAWKFDNEVAVATGAASNEGFATFQLQGETYFVVPVVDGAGARSAWFNITKADGTVMATVEENFTGLSSFNSFSAIELDDNTAIIYRWLPAKQVAVYAFQLPAVDGVEGIVADEEVVDAPAVYYNLNGVKVVNPSKGIYIVKRGNKVSKEYIR